MSNIMHGVTTPAPVSVTTDKPTDIYVFTPVSVSSESLPWAFDSPALPAPSPNHVSPDQFRADLYATRDHVLPGEFEIFDAKQGLGEFRYKRPGSGTAAAASARRPAPPSIALPPNRPAPPSAPVPPKGPEPKRPPRRPPPPEIEFQVIGPGT